MPSIAVGKRLQIGLVVLGALVGTLFALSVFVSRVDAQVQSPDAACRGCHDDSTRTLTLPSGEELTLRVDLPTLVASPHNHTATPSVGCTSCHTGQARYRYPHQPNPAQTQAEFRAEIATACADCHYPHLPFHDAETAAAEAAETGATETEAAGAETAATDAGADDDPETAGPLPICVDCHGSHDVAPIPAMGDTMPTACLACHTNRDAAWAAEFVAPRPGLGTGAAGFAGSIRCAGCHDALYFTWHDTLHANIVHDPIAAPDALLADFAADDPDLTFTRDEIAYVIGTRWRQVFLTSPSHAVAAAAPRATGQVTITIAMTGTVDMTATTSISTPIVAGNAPSTPTEPITAAALHLLPAQWTVATQSWDPLFGDGTAGDNWLASCAGCHVTGLDLAQGGFTEFGVGCESCHGPAAAHAADPENIQPFATVDDQVCGACHSRGESTDGHPYPTAYRPGDDLTAHFNLTQDPSALWADGSARLNHQQYMDWRLGSTMVMAPDTSCTTCHQVHAPGDTIAQLRQPSNELCLSCHGEQDAIVRHTPFHEKALTEREFLCTDCHMPKLASGAQPFDLHNHSLLQPDPAASVAQGQNGEGLAAMPNACNTCHTQSAESPEWAVHIISYAAVQVTPSASDFFGPGPTPTSPPPPTPVSSVGQRAEVELTPPLWWLRWLAFGVIGLVGLAVIVYLGNLVRQRRTRHV